MMSAGRREFLVADEVRRSFVDVFSADDAFHEDEHQAFAFSIIIPHNATSDKHDNGRYKGNSGDNTAITFQIHSVSIVCLISFQKELQSTK